MDAVARVPRSTDTGRACSRVLNAAGRGGNSSASACPAPPCPQRPDPLAHLSQAELTHLALGSHFFGHGGLVISRGLRRWFWSFGLRSHFPRSHPPLPLKATHSGHSGGPASPHDRHSSHPLGVPPGTARGHSCRLGAERGGQELPNARVWTLPVRPCACRPLPSPVLTSSTVGPVSAQLAHLTCRSMEALVAAAFPAAQEPVLALPVARAHTTQPPGARLTQCAEEAGAAVRHLWGGGRERPRTGQM